MEDATLHLAELCQPSITQASCQPSFTPDGRKPDGRKPSICRVPECVRRGDAEAYSPQIVSIGPYHRSMERLKAMESYKLISRNITLSQNKHISFARLVEEMERLESSIRSAYSEDIHLETKEFAEMIVLDGIFIIYLLKNPSDYYYRSSAGKWTMPFLVNDLLLLENQLPFFVLQTLFDLLYPKLSSGTLMKYAIEFFKKYSPIRDLTIKENGFPNDPCHLLHLVHKQLLPNPSDSPTSSPCCGFLGTTKKSTGSDSVLRIPSVTKLREAGISLKKKKICDLQVKFDHGSMEIPHLFVEDSTNSFFRNQIAWEQCYPDQTTNFTAYMLFMDYVVNTGKDVEILNEHGILEHILGSDKEVALLFNRICKGIAYDFNEDNFLKHVSEKVADYCEKPHHKWRATLFRDYFSSPWSSISLLAAIFLLILTFVSTFYSVFAYYHPP